MVSPARRVPSRSWPVERRRTTPRPSGFAAPASSFTLASFGTPGGAPQTPRTPPSASCAQLPVSVAALRLQVHCEALLEHALRWAVRAPERSLWERCRRCRAVLHLPLHCRSVLVMRARVPNKLAPLLSRATAPAAHMVSSPFPFSVATHPATLPRPLRVHVPASCRLQWSTSLALRPSLCPHLLSLWLRARLRAQWLVAARALRPHMPQQPSIAALLAENGRAAVTGHSATFEPAEFMLEAASHLCLVSRALLSRTRRHCSRTNSSLPAPPALSRRRCRVRPEPPRRHSKAASPGVFASCASKVTRKRHTSSHARGT
ncbi:hypothetical protein ERJ75_001085900 [Trypanosoma vivax]|nr:hypothetical protein ERJ75_001085900 [Trypanosoma vivax]